MSPVWLYVKGKWEPYTGTTSVRKLFYRARQALERGSKSFYVYEYLSRSVTGAKFPEDMHLYTSVTDINGVKIEDIPKEIHLRPNQQPFDCDQVMEKPESSAFRSILRTMRDEPTHRGYPDPSRLHYYNRVNGVRPPPHKVSSDKENIIYLAGSLRNPSIPTLAKDIRKATGTHVFCDWFAAGLEADDFWKSFYTEMGYGYREALQEPASVNTYNFDKKHIDASDVMVLALPAGKSGHLELGYFIGQGKPGYILLEEEDGRWDVMYQFAKGVTHDMEELCEWINGDLA